MGSSVLAPNRGDGVKGALSMEFQDKVLKCIDCGADFIFTAGEQLFFHDKQFKNEPKRCKGCKAKRVSVPLPNCHRTFTGSRMKISGSPRCRRTCRTWLG